MVDFHESYHISLPKWMKVAIYDGCIIYNKILVSFKSSECLSCLLYVVMYIVVIKPDKHLQISSYIARSRGN